MELRRGDLVLIVTAGDYGKPRPALVVQADAFADLPSLTVLPLSGTLRPRDLLRIMVEPAHANGLRKASQVMVDKALTVPVAKIGKRIGRLEAVTLRTVDAALARFLGFAREGLRDP